MTSPLRDGTGVPLCPRQHGHGSPAGTGGATDEFETFPAPARLSDAERERVIEELRTGAVEGPRPRQPGPTPHHPCHQAEFGHQLYADACNLFGSSHAGVAHKLEVLRAHCDDVGRDHAEIRRTAVYLGDRTPTADLDGFTVEMTGYAELGIETMILSPRVNNPAEWIERNAPSAVRRVAELG